MSTKFLFLLLEASRLIICCSGKYRSYGTMKNKALQHVFNSTIAMSDGDCCRACNLDESCVAANYERSTGKCELSDQHPMMDDIVIQTAVSSKDILFLNAGCRAPWIAFRGQCYLHNPTKLPWSNAEDYCVNLGGHLADIHDDDENKFVATFVTDWAWIGMTDIWNGQTRYWVTDAPVHYTRFHHNEPNNKNGKEHCVEIWKSALWNDCQCPLNHESICKKPCYIQ